MYTQDLVLNNLQWLICHKTQPNPTQPNVIQTKLYKEYCQHTLSIVEKTDPFLGGRGKQDRNRIHN